jgi:hypothetical protein
MFHDKSRPRPQVHRFHAYDGREITVHRRGTDGRAITVVTRPRVHRFDAYIDYRPPGAGGR